MNFKTGLDSLANKKTLEIVGFKSGFQEAFKIIDEKLNEELKKLQEFQPLGERLMTLKLYKAKIAGYLKEMEQEYE